ncbi:MAG: hypothetical protein FWC47_09740 [Oscillospiraceae bacterium]|nr:hypothetical protein [Oscillospiraceae bacterium]
MLITDTLAWKDNDQHKSDVLESHNNTYDDNLFFHSIENVQNLLPQAGDQDCLRFYTGNNIYLLLLIAIMFIKLFKYLLNNAWQKIKK